MGFIGIVLLCVNIILMFVFYRKVSHNFSQSAYCDSVREEVSKLIVDIEHESDRAITVLEDKIQELQQVRAEIDKHLLLVEQEHSKWLVHSNMSTQYDSKAAENQTDNNKKNTAIEMQSKPVIEKQPSLHTVQESRYKKTAGSVKIDLKGISPREQVIELTKKGFSVDFISQKVDLPVGEIDLIQSMTK